MNADLVDISLSSGVSVVVPIHNEAQVIEQVLRDLSATLDAAGWVFEILAVDDGSTDSTPEVLGSLCDQLPRLRVVRHEQNRGVGQAMATGFRAARMELSAIIDGDGQFDPNDLVTLLALAVRPWRCVLGVRIRRADPLVRRVLGRSGNFLASRILHARILDINCGLKIFRTAEIQRLDLRSRAGFINAEILRKLGVSTDEVIQATVRHKPRAKGSASGGSPRVILGIVQDAIQTTVPIVRRRK